MKQAAVGFRAHSGWTALVAIALTDEAPTVLARERLQLVKTFTYEFRQPYHTARNMSLAEAGAFLSRLRAEARALAFRALRKLQADLDAQDYKLACSGILLASGRPLPELAKILASHSIIHTADGEFFREALLHGSARCGLKSISVKEREVAKEAAQLLGMKPSEVTRRIAKLGKPLGPPWSMDEKLACAVAWLALASK